MNHHHHEQQERRQQQQQHNMQLGSGLTRYQSAPSSYFAAILSSNSASLGGPEAEDSVSDQFFIPRASSPETHRIFSSFMNSADTIQEMQPQSQSQVNSQLLQRRIRIEPQQPVQRELSNDYSSASSVMDNSYNRLLRSINSNHTGQMKMDAGRGGGSGGGNSNLIRQSSSPAGLFSSISIENDFVAMRNMGSFGASSSSNAEASLFSRNSIGDISRGDAQFEGDDGGYSEYIQRRFPATVWDDSEIMAENFLDNTTTSTNINPSDDQIMSCDEQKALVGPRPTTRLSHHLSLPKSCAELSAMERLLQDSVPCKIRAKRGCATHPRSIAERVRRTKISERIRKLQELVPNMEKQTNTADMLDLAVEYIKDLQTQVKRLSDNHAKCSCLAKQKVQIQRLQH